MDNILQTTAAATYVICLAAAVLLKAYFLTDNKNAYGLDN